MIMIMIMKIIGQIGCCLISHYGTACSGAGQPIKNDRVIIIITINSNT